MWLFKKIKEIVDSYHNKTLNGVHNVIQDTEANRPAAGQAGRLFISTDTKYIYLDTGSEWVYLGAKKLSELEVDAKSYRISDEIYAANDSVKYGISDSEIKMKEFKLPDDFPANKTIRVTWEYKSGGGGGTAPSYMTTQIRRNGTAVGETHTTSSSTYVKVIEDIGGFGPGDTVELWAWFSPGAYGYVRNFRILGDAIYLVKKYNIVVTLS